MIKYVLAGQVDDMYSTADVDHRCNQLEVGVPLVQALRDAPVHNAIGRRVIGCVPD